MILHVDLDAFFASVEQRDNPALRRKPVIVGGPLPSRGVVATASYEARKYGIHSGMPLFRAKKLCPQAVFIAGDFRKYEEASDKFAQICASYSPTVEQVSLDELYMDLSGTELLYGSRDVAREIQQRVYREIGITCSVGISAQKTFAKIASGFKKPNGITQVLVGNEKEFLAPMAVGQLPGCGKQTQKILKDLNIKTISEFAKMHPQHVGLLLGKNGLHLWQVANGTDNSRVTPQADAKSTSRSTTFPFDTNDRKFIESMLFYLAQRVAQDLRMMGVGGRCISVTIRTADFKTSSMQFSLLHPISTAHELFKEGKKLLNQLWDGATELRLIGIGVSAFNQLKSQNGLFYMFQLNEKWETLEVAMDKVRKKHGFLSIAPASLMKLKGIYPSNHRGFRP